MSHDLMKLETAFSKCKQRKHTHTRHLNGQCDAEARSNANYNILPPTKNKTRGKTQQTIKRTERFVANGHQLDRSALKFVKFFVYIAATTLVVENRNLRFLLTPRHR